MPLPVPVPASEVPGNYITSALWNSGVYNATTFLLNPPVFSGYQSAAQSIANAALVAIAIDTTTIDTYGGHSNTVNNSRYTPTVAGWYLVIASYGQAANGTGNRFASVAKNGSVVNLGQDGGTAAAGTNNGANQALAFVQCNGTSDYIEAYAYQSAGGALSTAPNQTGMQVIFLHA